MGFFKDLSKRAGSGISAGGDFLSGGASTVYNSSPVTATGNAIKGGTKAVGKGIQGTGNLIGDVVRSSTPSALMAQATEGLKGLGVGELVGGIGGGLGGLLKNPMTIIMVVVALVVVLMVMK